MRLSYLISTADVSHSLHQFFFFLTLSAHCRLFIAHLNRLVRCCTGHCKPLRRQPLYLTTLASENRAVWGVAWLADRIFVACSKSNSLMVYESKKPFRCIDEVVVTGLGDFWDIVACSANSCLYLSDFTNKCVWCVTSPDQIITR